jgi:hypothetical protein
MNLAGIDWGFDSILMEDLRTGSSTYFPANIWLTNRRKEAIIYADRDTPPLRMRASIYSELLRTVPKKQPDGSWDSISKRRRFNKDFKVVDASGAIVFSLRCTDLPKLDASSDSDPMVVVTMKSGLSSWQELYRTEVMINNNNPVFKKRKEIPFSSEATTWIKFSVYDVDDADGVLISAQDFCGFATVTLQSLAETGSLGGDCKLSLSRGEHAAGTIIVFDVNVSLKPPREVDAPVCARDVIIWLVGPESSRKEGAEVCSGDSVSVLNAIGAASINEFMATFSIAEEYATEQTKESCMLTKSALELLRADPAHAKDFYSVCHSASKSYKRMRGQVADGFIKLAMDESHEVLLNINSIICMSGFPPQFDTICMKYKIQLENFYVICSYAAKADLHSRLQFQIKVERPRIFICIC